LGAAQAAFQSHEETSTLKCLFAASDKSNTTVHRADQQNVQGLMFFHPVLLQAPWETSPTIGQDIVNFLEEKAPLIMAAGAAPGVGVLTQHEMQLQLTAKQTVDSMTSSLKLLLARMQKFTSHTFHVFIRDLIPGAKRWSLPIVYTHSGTPQSVLGQESFHKHSKIILCFGHVDFHSESFCTRKRKRNSYIVDGNIVTHSGFAPAIIPMASFF
jgi:hypothetical protein